MSSEENKKLPLEESIDPALVEEEDEEIDEHAIYVDANTGEEIFLDDLGPEEEDDDGDYELGEEFGEDDDDDDADAELDPTPLTPAWHTFHTHSDAVFTLKLNESSPGKILLASGGGDDLGYISSVGDGTAVPEDKYQYKLEGHTDSVAGVSFSSDGKLLATAGLDAILKIWNVNNGTLLHSLDGPSESIESVEWHSKGPVVLAGCGDGTIWMWDASPNGGHNLNVFGGHVGPVNSAKFTPDGTKVVSAGDDATLRIWGPKTGKSLHVISGHGFHEAGINCLQISADNTLAVTGGQDNLACITNIATGKVKATLTGHDDSVEEVAWVTGMPWVVTGSLDGKVGIWDLNTGQIRQFIENGSAGVTSIQCVGTNIVTSDTAGYLRLWDARAATAIQTIRAHSEAILAFDILQSARMIASASDDKTIKIFRY